MTQPDPTGETVSEFLLARLAEDEAVAEESLHRGFGGWEYFADHGVDYESRSHIVRFNPARVLADVAAKRAIVEIHAAIPVAELYACDVCDRAHPCPTIRALATIYADHPDYDDDWRPWGNEE